MFSLSQPPTGLRRRGTILVIAMVVLFAIAALVLTLGRSARTEALSAANSKAAAEADAVERGGEQYALSILANNADTLSDLTDDDFANVPVGGGAFWIIRPTYNDPAVSRFGLLDESTKLNLNSVSTTELSLLPGMTDDLANDIVAWRGGGGSNNSSGTDSGTIKNAPFETVDEMLLLNNMTRDLLYGVKPSTASPNVNDDWYQQHGLADYFTVWSTPSATAADGTARLNLSDPAAIADIRTFLGNTIHRGDNVVLVPDEDIFRLANQLQLNDDEFAEIEDYFTSFPPGGTAPPLVNVNTAPRETLIALGIADAGVDALIAARANAVASHPNSMGWVYDTLQQSSVGKGRLLTGRGRQYSADIVGASGNGRAFRRARIVIDTSKSPATIIYRRDITDRGWPLDQSILDDLRAGKNSGSRASSVGMAQ